MKTSAEIIQTVRMAQSVLASSGQGMTADSLHAVTARITELEAEVKAAWAAESRMHRERDEAEAERDDLAGRLSDYLDNSTGGVLSKTNYDVRTMIAATDEHYDKMHADQCYELEAERDEAVSERDGYAAVIEQAKVDINDLGRPWHRVFMKTLATLRSADTSTAVQEIRDTVLEEAAQLAENVEPIVNDPVMEGHAKNIGMVIAAAIRSQQGGGDGGN